MTSRREKIIQLEIRLKSKLYTRFPDYIFSNDLFEKRVKQALTKDTVWIDAGCGNNSLVDEFSTLSEQGTGTDCIVHPELKAANKFIKSDLSALPFKDSIADLVVSNMVSEHLEKPEKVFGEYLRVLKPGGILIFRTTNKFYPTLFLGHIFPNKMKDKIINKIFGVRSHDIFPTYYRINTYRKIYKMLPEYGFEIISLAAVEDLHLFHRAAFELSCLMYRIQRMKPFYFLRNTLVCLARKPD